MIDHISGVLKEAREKEKRIERVIPLAIVNEIETSTVQLANDSKDPDREFRLILVGHGNTVEMAIPIGTPAKGRVLPINGEIEQKILPLVRAGYEVLGDVHNHPSLNGKAYLSSGRPESHASSPSTGDITDLYRSDFAALGILVPPVRIITYFSESEQKVIWNGFRILQSPEDAGVDQVFEFESSLGEDQFLGFSIKKSRRDTDLTQLLDLKYIEPIKLTISSPDSSLNNIINVSESA